MEVAPFAGTLEAARVFFQSIRCASCDSNGGELNFVDPSCHHPFCFPCINNVLGADGSIVKCPKCSIPLSMTKIVSATAINTIYENLEMIEQIIDKYSSLDCSDSQAEVAATQQMVAAALDHGPTRTVHEFCATQRPEDRRTTPSPSPAPEEKPLVAREPSPADAASSGTSLSSELGDYHNTAPVPKCEPVSVMDREEDDYSPELSAGAPGGEQLFASQFVDFKKESETFVVPSSTSWFGNTKSRPIATAKRRGAATKSEKLWEESEQKIASNRSKCVVKEEGSVGGSGEGRLTRSRSRSRAPSATPEPEESSVTPRTRSNSTRVRHPTVARLSTGPDEEMSRRSIRSTVVSGVGEGARTPGIRRVESESPTGTPGSAKLKRQSTGAGDSLISTVLRNNPNRLKELLELDMDPNERDGQGWTALHHAARTDRADMAAMLVEFGAVVNAHTRNDCMTPLHVAVKFASNSTAEWLLKHGANRAAKDVNQQTPAALAAGNSPVRAALMQTAGKMLQIVPRPPRTRIAILLAHDIDNTKYRRLIKACMFQTASSLEQSTHLVVSSVDCEMDECVLEAVARGMSVVTADWLEQADRDKGVAPDEAAFEVRRLRINGLSFDNKTVTRSRQDAERMKPGLFKSCQFYFSNDRFNVFGPIAEKSLLKKVIELAGGEICARLPQKNVDDPPPYHNSQLKPYFKVYNPLTVASPARSAGSKTNPCAHMQLVTPTWILEAIADYRLTDRLY